MFSLAELGCREGGRHSQGREGWSGWNRSSQPISCHLDTKEATEEELAGHGPSPAPARIRVAGGAGQ